MENLKKQEREYLTLNRLILTTVFVIISIVISAVYLLVDGIPLKVFGGVLTGLWVLYMLIYFYLGAAFRHFNYAMNDHGLYINRGVFWRKRIVVPRNRVQHTDVNQGPLERKFDLAELIVHTAGTRNASVRLPGVMHEDAEALRESLSFEESNDAV